jgi:hypothetical protein
MIPLHGSRKILIAAQQVDFRRGINGLTALVAYASGVGRLARGDANR